MEANGFFDVYKQYKKGTAEIATWLVETASSIGIDVVSSAALKSFRQSSSVLRKLPVSVEDFSRLSKTIAGSIHASSIEFPPAIVETFKAVIAARQLSSQLYSQRGDQNNAEQLRCSLNHEYFIQVLQDSLDILQARLKPRVTERTRAVHKGTTSTNLTSSPTCSASTNEHRRPSTVRRRSNPLANMFDGLVVEDVEWRDSIPAPPVRQVSAAPTSMVVYDIEENLEDEFVLACNFFLQQCQELLDVIMESWKRVCKLDSTPINAALVANTAYDILHQTEMELYNAFSSLFTQEEIVEKIIASFSVEASKADSRMHNTNVDKIMQDTFKLMKSLHRKYGSHGNPDINDYHGDLLPAYSPAKGVFTLDQTLGAHLVRCNYVDKISSIMLDCILLIRHFGHVPMEDASIRGLKEMLNTGKINVSMVFSWLIVSIQLTSPVGSKHTQRFLQHVSELTIARAREHLAFEWKPVCCEMRESREAYLFLVKHIATWVRGDPVNKAKDALFGSKKNRPPSKFLLRHPLLTALLSFGILRIQHIHARWLSNDRRLIANLAHLYNAARQRKLVPRWEDMEQLITFHTEKGVFIGNRPTRRDNFYKRVTLINGGSIRNFSSDAHRHDSFLFNDQKDSHVQLHEPSIWSEYGEAWQFTPAGAFRSTSVPGNSQVPENMFTYFYESFKEIRAAKLHDCQPLMKGHTYLFFSIYVVEELQAQEDMLYFDYMAMIHKGVKLLKSLRDEFSEKSHKDLETLDNWDIKDHCVFQVVSHLLEDDSYQASKGSSHKSKGKEKSYLDDAAPKLKCLIEQEGNKETEAMHSLKQWARVTADKLFNVPEVLKKLWQDKDFVKSSATGHTGLAALRISMIERVPGFLLFENALAAALEKITAEPGDSGPINLGAFEMPKM